MTNHMFSVYDAKAEAYLAPFQASTYGIAERMFTDLVNDPKHIFNRHAEDYTLYLIGSFDDDTGELLHTELKPICPAITVKHEESLLPWEAQ